MNWILAQWVLSIWNPDLMDFLEEPRRSYQRMNYRARGIVLHDRALNGELK